MTKSEWQAKAKAHWERVSEKIASHRLRRSLHQKHPVEDFLFDYYSFRPSLLEKWSPGWGMVLEEASPSDFPEIQGWDQQLRGISLSLEHFPQHRLNALQWVIQLLKNTVDRPPQWGCYGLHEWAMVYRIPETRYPDIPLRMSHADLASFVESQSVCCTHYDAFRFYTSEAKPLNRYQPTKELRLDLEQNGCIHVNMDLYKWAYKFYPWTPSDLIFEAFEVASQARQIDMQASPYDLSRWGITPIKIETAEGKLFYIQHQKQIHERAIPLRKKLLEFYVGLAGKLEFHEGLS